MIVPSLIILALSLLSSALPSPFTLSQRDVAPADSITYCSPANQSDVQYFIPCTKTSDPKSEVQFQMPYFSGSAAPYDYYSAWFLCYARTDVGDRYLAGHPGSNQNPCWVTASLLGPTHSCPNPVPAGDTCGCSKDQLASCCAFRATGNDINGFINETYVHCA